MSQWTNVKNRDSCVSFKSTHTLAGNWAGSRLELGPPIGDVDLPAASKPAD